MKLTRIPIALAALYLLLVTVALVLMVLSPRDEFQAIFLVMLTLPWSAFLGMLLERVVPGVFEHSSLPAVVLALVGAALNALIIHGLARMVVGWIARKKKR